MFSRLSLKAKILSICVGLSIAVLSVGLNSVFSLRGVSEKYNHVAEINLPNAVLLGDMNLWSATLTTRVYWLAMILDDRSAVEKQLGSVQEAINQYEASNKRYETVPFVEGEQELYDAVAAGWKRQLELSKSVIELAKSQNSSDHLKLREIVSKEYPDATAATNKALMTLTSFQNGEKDKWSASAQSTATFSSSVAIGMAAISFMLALVIGISFASRLASTLRSISGQIAGAGAQVSSASQQLSTGSQQLASGATEAASSLEETVASVEELSSIVKSNAENAKEASTISLASRESAEKGEAEISSLINAMNDISQSSKKIEEIINVIDDIAFQTNLLALNAAVEAARAGEHGKGFAVVAEAVRTLAQRSAAAAKDITSLIKESVEKIENGSNIAGRSGAVLKNIVDSVKKVSELNNSIAVASGEQSNGISQISKAMTDLDKATQGNAATAEESAAASEELSAQAQELQNLVSQLTQVVEGASHAASNRALAKSEVKLRVIEGRNEFAKEVAKDDVADFKTVSGF